MYRHTQLAALVAMISLMVLLPAIRLISQEFPYPYLNSQDRENWNIGMSHFSQAVNHIWAGDSQYDDAVQYLNQAETSFQSVEDSVARNYLLARVELYRGRAVLMHSVKLSGQPSKISSKVKTEARTYLEKSMELVQASLNKYESADAYRVRADAGTVWMVTKGLFGIIKMAPKVREWSDKALSINPNNALAELISSQGKIHAPKSSGGNPEEAVRRLSILYNRPDLDKIERFRTAYGLVQAYQKIKDSETAAYYCEEARKLFPGNPYIDELCQK